MKLSQIKSLLESSQLKGVLTNNYGVICWNSEGVGTGDYKLTREEFDTLEIFVDKTQFKIALIKLYAENSQNLGPDETEDDLLLLTLEEMKEREDWNNFCDLIWFIDKFN